MAQANLADYFKMDQGGELALKDLDLLSLDQQLRIKKITATRNQYGQNITVELHDVMKANMYLAEINGVLNREASLLPPDEQARALRDAIRQMDEIDQIAPPQNHTLQ